MSPELSKLLNALGLIAIGTVLTMAFIDQVWFGELPCPLCILQRAGLIAAGCGIVWESHPATEVLESRLKVERWLETLVEVTGA